MNRELLNEHVACRHNKRGQRHARTGRPLQEWSKHSGTGGYSGGEERKEAAVGGHPLLRRPFPRSTHRRPHRHRRRLRCWSCGTPPHTRSHRQSHSLRWMRRQQRLMTRAEKRGEREEDDHDDTVYQRQARGTGNITHEERTHVDDEEREGSSREEGGGGRAGGSVHATQGRGHR